MTSFKKRHFIFGVIMLMAVSFSVMGCKRITMENYRKLNSGMTYEEVQKIFGEPAGCETSIGIKSCSWKDGDKSIDIKFLADKVFLFSNENL